MAQRYSRKFVSGHRSLTGNLKKELSVFLAGLIHHKVLHVGGRNHKGVRGLHGIGHVGSNGIVVNFVPNRPHDKKSKKQSQTDYDLTGRSGINTDCIPYETKTITMRVKQVIIIMTEGPKVRIVIATTNWMATPKSPSSLEPEASMRRPGEPVPVVFAHRPRSEAEKDKPSPRTIAAKTCGPLFS